MTARQLEIAAAVLVELRFAAEDVQRAYDGALSVLCILDAQGLPRLNGDLLPKLIQLAAVARDAADEAADAYAEFLAPHQLPQAAGGMTATSFDGLTRAITPDQSNAPATVGESAGIRSGAGAAHPLKAAA